MYPCLSSARRHALTRVASLVDVKHAAGMTAKYGHVDVFNLLLKHGADIKRRGPNQHTALDVAIERDQRGIIHSVIEGSHWEEAFQVASTSKKGELDTPLRNLIRRFPDVAEEFLDRCCTVKPKQATENSEVEDVIEMNYDFIEDTHSYKSARNKEGPDTLFCHNDEVKEFDKQNHPLVVVAKERNFDLEQLKDYEVDLNNHPLMIMAKERRVDLLQHPLCLAITLEKWTLHGRSFYFSQLFLYIVYLLALNLFILSSDSPLDWPEKFNCSGAFVNESSDDKEKRVNHHNRLAHGNEGFRYTLLVLNAARLVFFFVSKEYKPIFSQLKIFQWKRPSNLPTVFLFDAVVYGLSLFVALHHLIWQEASCLQWQICAVTITLAWINLLLQMRLLYGIGQHTCYLLKIYTESIERLEILGLNDFQM